MSKILLVGESCTDVFVYGKATRLSPEGPAPVFIPNRETENGGMSMNVEANLIALGCDVKLVTNGLNVIKKRFVDEASNTLLLRVDVNDDVDRVEDRALTDINYWDYDMVVISDYNKGFLTEEDIAYIAFKHPNVICDTKKQFGEWCKDLRFIKINRSEYENNEDYILKNDWILEKLIITLDKDGCRYMNKMYPTTKVDILDISGAGDTFVAGFVWEYIKSQSIEKSIGFGNLCASQVVQKRGVSVVDYENLF